MSRRNTLKAKAERRQARTIRHARAEIALANQILPDGPIQLEADERARMLAEIDAELAS